MKIPVRRLTLKDILEIFFIILLIPPSFIQINTPVYRANLIFQCVVAVILMFLIFMYRLSDTFLGLVLFFYGIQVLSTIVENNSYWVGGLRESLCSLSIILFFFFIIKKDDEEMMANINLVFSLYVILNFIFTFFRPEFFGIYSSARSEQYIYFLGIKNQMAAVLVPYLAYIVIYNFKWREKRNFFTFILLFLGFFTEIRIDSGTGYLAIFAIIILYLLFNKITEHALSLRAVLIIFLIVNILVVFLQVLVENTSLGTFIQDVFHRDITLSNRTTIWAMALRRFATSPWLGLGRQQNRSMVTFHAANIWDTDTYYSAHNVLLQTLLESGVLGMIPLIILLIVTVRKFNIYKCNLMHVIIIGLCGVLVSHLAESYDLTYLFVFLSMIFEFNYFSAEAYEEAQNAG